MTPAKRLFDEDQERQIIDAYMAGETVQKLAKIWGSEKANRNILKRAGIKKSDRQKKKYWKVDGALHPQIEQDYRAGGFTHVIAEQFGVSAPTIKSILVERSVPIRTSGESKTNPIGVSRTRVLDDVAKQIKTLYEEGIKQKDVALVVDV